MNLQDRKQMEDFYRNCEENKMENYQNFPYTCPSCQSLSDGGETNCSVCNFKVQFCYLVKEKHKFYNFFKNYL